MSRELSDPSQVWRTSSGGCASSSLTVISGVNPSPLLFFLTAERGRSLGCMGSSRMSASSAAEAADPSCRGPRRVTVPSPPAGCRAVMDGPPMDWEQCCSIPDDGSLARVDANSALTRPLDPDRFGGAAEAGLSCMALNATVHAVEGRSAGARLGLGLSSLAGWLASQLTGAGPACSHIPMANLMVGSSKGCLGLPSAGPLSFLLKLQGAQVPASSAPPLALPAS